MAYTADSFIAGEQPTTSKWNELWANDASFHDGTGIANNAITAPLLATNAITLGYTQITAGVGSLTSTGGQQITGMTVTVTIPAGGRKVKITAFIPDSSNTANVGHTLQIWDGTVGAGTQLGAANAKNRTAGDNTGFMEVSATYTPSAGSKTYNVGLAVTSGTGTVTAASTTPAYILVETI